MIVVFTCSLIALLLTYLEGAGRTPNGMFWGFFIVTFLGCIHYNYGNDYSNYHLIYCDIVSVPFDLKSIFRGLVYKDYGWVLLCYLFDFEGGFYVMVATLNIVQNIIIYNFIRQNVRREWWTLSVFSYLFVPVLYLYNFSMMRQGLVVAVFLATWPLIREKKWWLALPILYLCSFVHSSAVVLLPFSFWGFLPFGKPRVILAMFVSVALSLFVFYDSVGSILAELVWADDISTFFSTYEEVGAAPSFGFGYFLSLLPFFVFVYLLWTRISIDSSLLCLISLSFVGVLIKPYSMIVPMVLRLGIYFTAFSTVALPNLYGSVTNAHLLKFLLVSYVVLTMYGYWLFFSRGVFSEPYSTFRTIMDVL